MRSDDANLRLTERKDGMESFFFFFWRDDKLNSILELVKMKMKRGYKRSGLTIDQNERNCVSGWVQPTQNA